MRYGWSRAGRRRNGAFGQQLTNHAAGKVNINTASDEVMIASSRPMSCPPHRMRVHSTASANREYMWFASFNNGKDFATIQNQG